MKMHCFIKLQIVFHQKLGFYIENISIKFQKVVSDGETPEVRENVENLC